jgi:predicted nucleic acid-binding protein
VTTPVFVDTSALYAVLDEGDESHPVAAQAWSDLLDGIESDEFEAVTHSSVIVEIVAPAQRGLGIDAARIVLDDIVPLFSTVWVDQQLHDRAAAALLAAGLRHVSLVDWTSFEVMRER